MPGPEGAGGAWAGRLAPGTQAPQPQAPKDYSLLHGLGGPGLHLQAGLSADVGPACPISSPCGNVCRRNTRPAVRPGQDSAGNELVRKAKDDLSVLGMWGRAFAVLRGMG